MTQDTAVEDWKWRTDDVLLAAFLSMYVDVEDTEWVRGEDGEWKCFWVFEDTDRLADLVSEYIGGAANENLKEYNGQVSVLKRAMITEHKRRRQVDRNYA